MKLSPEHVRLWGASERKVFAKLLNQIYGTDAALGARNSQQLNTQHSGKNIRQSAIRPWEKRGRMIQDLLQHLSVCRVSIFYTPLLIDALSDSQEGNNVVRRTDLLAACWALGSAKSPFSWWENGTPNTLEALQLPPRIGAVIDPSEKILESIPIERILYAFLPKSTDMEALTDGIAGNSSQHKSLIEANVMRALAHRKKLHVINTDAGFWVQPM